MTFQIRRDGAQIIVFGKTYDHRNFIKSLGGRFDGESKVWLVPFSDQTYTQLEAFSIGGGSATISAAEVTVRPTLVLESPMIADSSSAGLKVSELVGKAQQAITAAFSGPVWVIGEIHNLADKTSGLFFSLGEAKDGASEVASIEVKATLWRSTLNSLMNNKGKDAVAAVLQDGMQARMLCQVSLYRDRAQLSLNVIDIDPAFTKGALALAREALLKELRAKGLDRKNKSLRMPRFPLRVGLISAAGSRAYSDFTEQLWSYGFPGEVYFVATATQGEAVTRTVCMAIKRLIRENCDVIVMTRGGGSAADLRWFDAKEIAYAIAECPVPVVAAIGHHDDVSVAELLSFAHEKTPTAAADFINNIFQQTRMIVQNQSLALAQTLMRSTNEASRIQEQLAHRLRQAVHLCVANAERSLMRNSVALTSAMRDAHARAARRVDELKNNLRQRFINVVHTRDMQLTQLIAALSKVDPRPWLQAGWTQLTFNKQPVTSIAQVQQTDLVSARLLDGKLTLQVIDKQGGQHG